MSTPACVDRKHFRSFSTMSVLEFFLWHYYDVCPCIMDLTGLITHRINIDQFEQAFEYMISGEAGKVVMDWS